MYLAPIAAPRGFVMRELYHHVGARSDVQRFFDSLDQPIALIANVRCVERRTGFARRDCAARELIQIRIASWFVDQTARNTDCTFLDRFTHKTRLRMKLVAFQTAVCRTGDARARRAESDE